MENANAGSVRALIVPGIGDSGPEHWQSLWERADPTLHRVQQRDWLNPDCASWCRALEQAVLGCEEVLLIAHSLGCLAVGHWQRSGSVARVSGALLVAPPNPAREDFPASATGFRPVPVAPLAFPSILVASADDHYATLSYSRGLASAWGSRFVDLGPAGHINGDSGFGPWPQGLALLGELRAGRPELSATRPAGRP